DKHKICDENNKNNIYDENDKNKIYDENNKNNIYDKKNNVEKNNKIDNKTNVYESIVEKHYCDHSDIEKNKGQKIDIQYSIEKNHFDSIQNDPLEEKEELMNTYKKGHSFNKVKELYEQESLDIYNKKNLDFNSRSHYNAYSVFNEKEPTLKYNATNITQLLTSLFGFRNRDDKYSLNKKQSMCSLLTSKKSYSNIISLKDYLQRQYEIIIKPSENITSFVKSHVIKINVPLLNFLKKITNLSNIKIQLSLKLCNNDLNKSLNFIVCTWGINILKKKSPAKYSSSWNQIPEYRREFKKILGYHNFSSKSSLDTSKCVNKLDSVSEMDSTNYTNISYYKMLKDVKSLYDEGSKKRIHTDECIYRIEDEEEEEKKKNKQEINNNYILSLLRKKEKNEIGKRIIDRKEKIKDEKETDYSPKDTSSEVSTSTDMMKFTQLCTNKKENKEKEDNHVHRKITKSDIITNKKEKHDVNNIEEIQKNDTDILINNDVNKNKSDMLKRADNYIISNNNNNNISLKKTIGESSFFYAKLPSGELIKLKVNDSVELSTHDSMPLLLVEPIDDITDEMKKEITEWNSLSKMNSQTSSKENTMSDNNNLHKDYLINDLEVMYNKLNKKGSIESTFSMESERSVTSRLSPSIPGETLTSLVNVKDKKEIIVEDKRE
ncbi:hypothetical protein PFTANZ_05808, partial [Plasmodium falciparum Tanzania (2000708)]